MFWEQNHPWLIALAVITLIGIVATVCGWDMGYPEKGGFIMLGASAGGSASFAAFLVTTLSFLLGVDSPAARRVFETKYRDVLLSYFRQAIYGWVSFFLASLGGFYFFESECYFYFWVALLVFACLAFLRCARLLFLLLRQNKTKY